MRALTYIEPKRAVALTCYCKAMAQPTRRVALSSGGINVALDHLFGVVFPQP